MNADRQRHQKSRGRRAALGDGASVIEKCARRVANSAEAPPPCLLLLSSDNTSVSALLLSATMGSKSLGPICSRTHRPTNDISVQLAKLVFFGRGSEWRRQRLGIGGEPAVV